MNRSLPAIFTSRHARANIPLPLSQPRMAPGHSPLRAPALCQHKRQCPRCQVGDEKHRSREESTRVTHTEPRGRCSTSAPACIPLMPAFFGSNSAWPGSADLPTGSNLMRLRQALKSAPKHHKSQVTGLKSIDPTRPSRSLVCSGSQSYATAQT